MDEVIIAGFVCVVFGYLCGSIPFGLLIGKWVAGVDIREHGSRNIGATNCGRVVGRGWGLLAFVLDVAKGAVPVAMLTPPVQEPLYGSLQVLSGLSAILGHVFPIWLRYRGGKGAATGLGVGLGLCPLGAGIGFGVWALTVAITRYVSLGSMLGAAAFAVAAILLSGDPLGPTQWPRSTFYVVVCVLVIARHRANIGRLLRGEENRIGRKPAPQTDSPDGE